MLPRIRAKFVLLAVVAVASSFVFPQSASAAAGKTIKNTSWGQCLEAGDLDDSRVNILDCKTNEPLQHWTVAGKAIKNVAREECLAAVTAGEDVVMSECRAGEPAQQWAVTGKSFKNVHVGQCLASNGPSRYVRTEPCTDEVNQQWTISS
ncbi:ricin-type beta-trefoil lectin domain protein [Nocardia sp. NPDC057030]|uniref:RICIN domain-containing protein n=1 Tax=unclassified Nocardia TaxID=2637762 RepID=UPI00363D6B89